MGNSLVIGGARSGKSTFAERYAQKLAEEMAVNVTFIATAQPIDDEMADRISKHKRQRPSGWVTVEEPINVAACIKRDNNSTILLLDCLSLLLNNWMFVGTKTEDDFAERQHELELAIRERSRPMIIVTNEVGHGIVPGDVLSRQYRDWLGILNQRIANVCDEVFLLVAGIPIDVRKWQANL